MVLRDLFRDVFQTLWAHKLRTTLTMFGIAWGVISIVLMVAAGEGLRVGQAKVSENFGRDLMIVFAGRTSLPAGREPDARLNILTATSPSYRPILRIVSGCCRSWKPVAPAFTATTTPARRR
jgi:hypothetical protein